LIHVCFLLHMHQPQYVDPRTRRAELPWVRLHGIRAYLDVARLLDEFTEVRLTVNFVPSLVEQLEEVVSGPPENDAWLRVALKPAAELEPDEREFLVTRLFSLNWGRSIDPRPRYRELLDKRGRQVRPEDLRARAMQFTDAEVRDLTVLFNLSWFGFAAREGDLELAALEQRGRDYTDEDLRLVVERQRQVCARVLPLWRKLSERGQVELSSSPYYHPILPLVIDTDHARRSRPDLPLPDHFAWAEDARRQIDQAKAAHTRWFGRAPDGMWPPEGSVSPEAVAAYRSAGVKWLATDEGNLWRTLSSRSNVVRGDLYRAYRYDGVDLVFRDREISDRIGFAYAHGDSAAGAEDLLQRARARGAESTAPEGEPRLVPIFLDGENPWESYPGGGEPFLRALFAGLTRDPGLRAVSVGEHLRVAGSRVELPQLHSGSWIDSDFHIWIGDPIKNRAWDLLARVRRRLERARAAGVPRERLEAATEHVLAAEGSDWFWWFGEPFHSAEDAIFDRLFRAHLAGALAAIGEPVPIELEHPVAPGARGPGAASPLGMDSSFAPPYAFIRPRIGAGGANGGSFYEWHGAGRYLVPRGAAMADTPIVERILFGFDRDHLYVRVDPTPSGATQLDDARLSIELAGTGRRVRVRLDTRAAAQSWSLDEASEDGGSWREIGVGSPAQVGPHGILRLGVPFAQLGVQPGAHLEIAFKLERGEVAIARYPADGTLPLTVPDDAFEAENWSA
jgi:alpha-amylase/alpha-mannosidase (GH57 family)